MNMKCTGWTQNGTAIEAPIGYNVSDYFRDGKFLGPDADGIAPVIAKPSVKIQLPTYSNYYGGECEASRVEEINDKLEGFISSEFSDRAEISFERTGTPRGNGITCEDDELASEIHAWIQENWTAAL